MRGLRIIDTYSSAPFLKALSTVKRLLMRLGRRREYPLSKSDVKRWTLRDNLK